MRHITPLFFLNHPIIQLSNHHPLQILIQRLQHLVRRGHDFAVHFVDALRLNQVSQFCNWIDVRGFQKALYQGAEAIKSGRPDDGWAGSRGFGKQVIAKALQTGFVDEIDSLYSAQNLRCGLQRDGHV